MEHLLQGWREDPHGHWTDRGIGDREPSIRTSNRGEEVRKSITRTNEEQLKDKQHRRTTDKEWSNEEVAKEVLVSSRGWGQEGEKLGISQEGSVGRGQKVTIGGNQ